MPGSVFLDTNVVVYAIESAGPDPEKSSTAGALARRTAAARLAACDLVYTEDLNDGQDYGGVRVENPFRS